MIKTAEAKISAETSSEWFIENRNMVKTSLVGIVEVVGFDFDNTVFAGMTRRDRMNITKSYCEMKGL